MSESMRITSLTLGMVSTRCYIAYHNQTKEAFIIDPAGEAERIIATCKELQVIPKAVLLTHGHFDHILAAKECSKHFSIEIYAHIEEKELLSNGSYNLSSMWSTPMGISADKLINDGDMLQLCGFTLQVIHTPGHTPGSVCYYCKEEGVLFSGDTLFYHSLGRTDFPLSNTASIIRSIREKLFVLPEDTMVYPGHDRETTIGEEKRNNPVATYKG